jgi:hypothetical protein
MMWVFEVWQLQTMQANWWQGTAKVMFMYAALAMQVKILHFSRRLKHTLSNTSLSAL